MAEQVYLTKEGYKELEARLLYLKSEGRVAVADKISVARSFGDISENSEYDAAREEEALLEQEIVEIENTLRNAKIISKSKVDTAKVNVGATVKVKDKEFNDELTFSIIGSFESDPAKGLISNESPTGKALLGKSVGDIVTVDVPGSNMKITYQVLEINY
ncbi:MAG: transcription elongation factor GreA [Clostridiales bacterium]|nr:transcription elongation factor GreA [Clostridiales bacterium]